MSIKETPETPEVETEEVINQPETEEVPAETPETPEETPEEKVTPEVETPEEDGQVKDDEATIVDPLTALAEKKGWDVEKAQDFLLESYGQLESKLGNWKEVERRAALVEQFQQKAEMWDAAQRYLDTADKDGKPDLTRLDTRSLASLWRQGQIGLNDIPANKQFEVQQFVQSATLAQRQAYDSQATKIVTDNPFLKENPDAVEMVAVQIEKGVKPNEAVAQVKKLMQTGERNAEQRIKTETAKLKAGNLESTGSPASTKPKESIRTVGDAIKAAKAEIAAKS